MTKTEIEKAIRKQKPFASFVEANKTGLLYRTLISGPVTITFLVPLTDIGDGRFLETMESQLLIRYLITSE